MFISCSSAEGNSSDVKRSCIHASFLIFGPFGGDKFTLAFTKPYLYLCKGAPRFKYAFYHVSY
jgi:hypothetical protein